MDELMSEFEGLTIPFGKYEGETIGDIAQTDISYLSYIAENERNEFSRFILNKYLEWLGK